MEQCVARVEAEILRGAEVQGIAVKFRNDTRRPIQDIYEELAQKLELQRKTDEVSKDAAKKAEAAKAAKAAAKKTSKEYNEKVAKEAVDRVKKEVTEKVTQKDADEITQDIITEEYKKNTREEMKNGE